MSKKQAMHSVRGLFVHNKYYKTFVIGQELDFTNGSWEWVLENLSNTTGEFPRSIASGDDFVLVEFANGNIIKYVKGEYVA